MNDNCGSIYRGGYLLALLATLTAMGVAAPRISVAAESRPVTSSPAAQQGDITEIIVTAQRREESIQDVGISITALSGDSLAELGMQSTQAIAAHVPGLIFDGGSGGGVNAFVTIRGVTQVDPAEHQEAPNAVYLDDAYVPTTSMVGFPLYDVARAEALRGPQGTLFGRNSTGGLLQFVTNDPSASSKGFVDASYGNYNLFRLEAAYGGPITDSLRFRVAGFATRGDGIMRNENPGMKDSFETKSFGIRGKMAADFGGGWAAQLTASLNRQPRHREGVYKATPAYVDANGTAQYLPSNVDFYGTGPGKDPFGYRDASNDPWTASFDSNVSFLEKQYDYLTLKLTGGIGDASLTSITNYSHGKIAYVEDTDSTPNPINNFGSGGGTNQITEELRLSGQKGKLEWTAGLYLLRISGKYYTDFDLPFLATTPTPFHTFNSYSQKTRSYALFTQLEYKFTDELKLTAGIRYNHDSKDFESRVYDVTTQPNPVIYDFSSATVGNLAHFSHGDWTGKLQLDYKPSQALLVYGGVSRGIRAGGFNASPDGAISLAATPFRNESVIDYEGGVKLRVLSDMASLRASAFYYVYNDFQAFNFIGTAGGVANNDAKIYGGEVEFAMRSQHGLELSLGGAVNHGKIKDYRSPLGTIIDTDPLKAPHFTANWILAQEFNVGEHQLRLQYDGDYQSLSRANLLPSPITTLHASTIQNLRLSFGRKSQGWETYAFVHNLANAARKNYAYDITFIGGAIASYAPPRMYGIGIRANY